MEKKIKYDQDHCLSWTARMNIDKTIKTGVTKQFRDLLLDKYPGLLKDSRYLRMAAYLLFSNFIDENSGNPITDWPTLGHLEKKDFEVYHKNYNGGQFLEEFQAEVMTKKTFTWKVHRYFAHEARVVNIEWDEEIILALREEHMNRHKGIKLVYIVSGRRVYKRERSRKNRNKHRQVVNAVPIEHPAKKVIQYLYTRNQRIYTTKLMQNVEKARELINELPPAKKIGEKIIDIQHSILTKIIDTPKPIYMTSRNGRTDRIFDISGYMGLKRDVRKQLLSGCVDYDLKSCQLAICAYTWNVPVVIEFIEEGKCIWSSMLEYLGHDPDMKNNDPILFKAMKDPLKINLYQSLYGMKEAALRYYLLTQTEILWKRRAGRKPTELMEHPIIKSLLEARGDQMKKIEEEGYAYTCFGRRIEIGNDEDMIKSALAQQAQAIELNLLLPVIDVAQQSNNELQILLWCHDGFVAHVNHKKNIKTWNKRLNEAVKRRAEELRIKIELESEIM